MPHQHKCGFNMLQPLNLQIILGMAVPEKEGCGHVWTHEDGSDDNHVCPKCGKGPWLWRFDKETVKTREQELNTTKSSDEVLLWR